MTKNILGKIACVYHFVDFDGLASAKIVQSKYPECDLFGWNYGNHIPRSELQHYDTIIMVDISFPSEYMLYLEKTKNVIWIDHHISAIKDSKMYGYDDMHGMRNKKKAACRLTWEYFYPDKVLPRGIKYFAIYDIWDRKNEKRWNEKILPYQFAMRDMATTIDDLDWEYMKDKEVIKDLIQMGNIILSYQKKQYDRIKYFAHPVTFEGYKFLAINHSSSTSMVLEDIFTDEYDAMMVYRFNGKKGNWNISMFTTEAHDIDLSVIAKKYDGGGHAKACGFVADTKNLIDWGVIC